MAWVYPETEEERKAIILEYGLDPEDHTLMTSGGIRCISSGRIVKKIPSASTITATNAHEYHEKYRQVRIRAMRQALQQETGHKFGDSLVILGRAMVQEALDGKGISKVKAAQLIYDHLELSPATNQAQNQPGITVSDNSVAALRDIVQAIADIRHNSEP